MLIGRGARRMHTVLAALGSHGVAACKKQQPHTVDEATSMQNVSYAEHTGSIRPTLPTDGLQHGSAYHSIVASGEKAAVELLLEDCWLHAEVGDRRARLSEAAKASLGCDGPNLAGRRWLARTDNAAHPFDESSNGS